MRFLIILNKVIQNSALFIIPIFSIVFIISCTNPQNNSNNNGDKLLKCSPMPGYSTMQEVVVWVQTQKTADVYMKYYHHSKDTNISHYSDTIHTYKEKANTAHLIADQLEPGKEYSYEVYVDNKKYNTDLELSFKTQKLWQWRKKPPDFSFALGSCSYINEKKYDRPGTPYGRNYNIFRSIADKDPDMMLWLGDNVYLREADWWSKAGMLHRYTHTRSLPELQRLLATTHHYAIWDDHDFGPNNSNGSWVHKERALKVFKMFWANNDYGVNGNKGITSQFQFNDVQFFLMDNRYYRTPKDLKSAKKRILGKTQINWLINALKSSNANFKFIVMGGQFLNTAKVYENYANYERERKLLINKIQKEQIKNIIFLTGDRHHSELSVLNNKDTPRIIDFTVSPLTSRPSGNKNEKNRLRVNGTFVKKNNFGIVDVKGNNKNRSVILKIFNNKGKEIWQRTFDKK